LNRSLVCLFACFTIAVVCAILSLGVGAVSISFADIIDAVFTPSAISTSGTEQSILLQLRLPRIVSACVVGASLGAAGVGFQGLFRNSLADPYVIGASSGAALGVTLAVTLGFQSAAFGFHALAFAAMLGCVGAVAVILAIGMTCTDRSPLSLLLAGVAISSLFNAIVSLLMFLENEKVVVIFSWLMGSLAGNDWDMLRTTTILSLMGIGLLWCLARPMDANLLGNQTAASLGLNLFKFQILVVLAASVVTASAVALAGIVGFIGLISPHVARYLVGPKHFWLLPISCCIGATILIVSDALARTVIAPSELPVGIVTALLGCPFFLFLLGRRDPLPGSHA
jgi:iron complex transport system permease protein